MRPSRIVFTSALVAALGCHGAGYPDPGEVVWEGESVVYAEEEGVKASCDGSMPWMDRFVGSVADELGVALEEPLRVYRVSGDTAREICPEGATRCARGGRVYSTATIERHEPVHALRQIEYGL